MIRAYDSLPNPITNSGAPRLNPRTSYYSSEPARYQRRITFKQKGENSTSYRKHNNGKCNIIKHTFQEFITLHKTCIYLRYKVNMFHTIKHRNQIHNLIY